MIYAPVLIPTLCRYDKFVRCFESLQKNTWANMTDVFVALDYPKKKEHIDGYERIKKYCNQFIENNSSGFKSLTLICRKRNRGAIGNFESLVNETFNMYDRCICTFDDIEHSPNFIQYMDKMLELFKDDNSVCMVTGYSYPVKWKVDNETNLVNQQLEGSIWGVGYWKNDWNNMYKYLHSGKIIKRFSDAFINGDFERMTDWAIKDYVNAVVDGVAYNSLLKRVTDISMRIYLVVENKYCIMPIVSKTRNIGFDGSGAYCEEIIFNESVETTSSNYRFDLQPIDQSQTFIPNKCSYFSHAENFYIINSFDKRPVGERESNIKRAEEYSRLNITQKTMRNYKVNINRLFSRIRRVFF